MLETVKPLDKKNIQNLLKTKQYGLLRHTFSEADPADVADLIEELEPEEVELVFSILDNELASEVIVEMEASDIEDVVENLSPDKIAGMLQEMAPDDAADILNEMDEDDQSTVLHLMDPDKKEELQELAEYDSDSAGGLMTPEYYGVPDNITVEEAVRSLSADDFDDPVTTVFALDSEGKLTGSIHISELIAQPADALIRDVVDTQLIYAKVDEPGSEVARKFRKYDLVVIPVVDSEFRLVGRITVDDVIDFIDDEATEDIALMAGAPDLEQRELSPISIVRLRLPWLLITMLTGSIVGLIVQNILKIPAAAGLTAFVPLILGMGGNTGMQSTAVTVRNIAIGDINFAHLFENFLRELSVGAMMGVVCGVIVSGVVYTNMVFFSRMALQEAATDRQTIETISAKVDETGVFSQEILQTDSDTMTHPTSFAALPRMMLVVACSMFVTMSFAAFSGTMMPILLHKLHIDPAVASGPFVSTGNDLSASLIYLGMCYLLL